MARKCLPDVAIANEPDWDGSIFVQDNLDPNTIVFDDIDLGCTTPRATADPTPSLEGYWDRDSGTGTLYPKVLADMVMVGKTAQSYDETFGVVGKIYSTAGYMMGPGTQLIYASNSTTMGIYVQDRNTLYIRRGHLRGPQANAPMINTLDVTTSASTPPFTFYTDQDTGMYRHEANGLAFSGGGVNKLVLNADGTIQLVSTPATAADAAVPVLARNAATGLIEQRVLTELHEHANIDVLDLLTAPAGSLWYDGALVFDSSQYYTTTEIDAAHVVLQTDIDTRSLTSHNHNLADLAERSYNSLVDQPDLSDLHAHSNKPTLDRIPDYAPALQDDIMVRDGGGITWMPLSGIAGVQIFGTPSDNQIAVWTNATTIEGTPYFTISGSTLTTRYILPETTVFWTLGDNSHYWTALYSNYVRFVDSGTNITRDGANNLSFTDAITGTATLAELVNQIDISGSPVNNQLAVWVDSDTVEGDPGLTWSGTILDTTGTILVDAIDEHTGDVGITIDGGLLKDNKIGDVSNYWDDAYIRDIYMLDSGGSAASQITVDNIDIVYIKAGAGETWFDTASIGNRIRMSANNLGSNYYMSITGYNLEHFYNGSVINKIDSSGIRTTGVIETDDIIEVIADHGVEIEGVTLRDSYTWFTEVTTPGTPAVNTGYLYMDTSDEHIYFKTSSTTYDLTATGGGAGLAWSGSGSNKLGTWYDANTILVEDNLQFDGTTLAITGTLTVSAISSSITQQRVLFYNSTTGVLSYGPNGGAAGTTFLRDDGTWVTPSGAGDVTATSYTQYDLAVWDSTAKNLIDTAGNVTWNGSTLAITGTLTVSAITAGPAEYKVLFYNAATDAFNYLDGGGSTTEYLRGDGSFAVPAGSSEMIWDNGGSDRIGTYGDADTIYAESNLTFSIASGLYALSTGSDIAKFNSSMSTYAGILIDGTATTDTLLTFQQAAVDKASIGWDVGTASFRISVGGSNVFTSLNKMAIFYPGGASELYHSNLKKLATTATGIDVTGRAVVDGLTTSSHIYGASSIDIGSVTQYFRHGYFSGSVYSDDSLILNWEGTPQTLDANNDGIYTTSNVAIGTYPSGVYKLYVSGDVYASGDVDIGGTNATTKLYVYSNTSGEYTAYFNQDHATGHGIRVDIDATSGTTYSVFRGYRDSTLIANLRSDGKWWAADYLLSSDKRMKDVYQTVDNGLESVMKLNPVTYRWKDKRDDDIHVGFVAQEVQKFFPELVSEDSDGYMSLSYTKMSALAIAGVQGLSRKVNTIEGQLRKEIVDLKIRVKELEDGKSS